MFWWEHLQTLRADEECTSAQLEALLDAASKAVGQDVVWASSGLEQMLQGAKEETVLHTRESSRPQSSGLPHTERAALLRHFRLHIIGLRGA